MVLDVTQRPEWATLSLRDCALLTPEVVLRWAPDLDAGDCTLHDIARFERKRRENIQTLRTGAELQDQEWKLLRYLQRREGSTCTYLEIARHLWQTPVRRITAQSLISMDAGKYGFGGMVTTIQGMVHDIRRKLEIDPLRPQHLANIRGVGYRWYSAAPSLDDGENYERRATESAVLREKLYREMGLVEGEFVAVSSKNETSLSLSSEDSASPVPEPVPNGRSPRSLPSPPRS